jgi:hypothetical protein
MVQSAFGDERNAAAEVMIGGTQRKQFLDIPSQGKHYELPHAFILAVDDNSLISVITAYWDNLSFYSQLGKIALDQLNWSSSRAPNPAQRGQSYLLSLLPRPRSCTGQSAMTLCSLSPIT